MLSDTPDDGGDALGEAVFEGREGSLLSERSEASVASERVMRMHKGNVKRATNAVVSGQAQNRSKGGRKESISTLYT